MKNQIRSAFLPLVLLLPAASVHAQSPASVAHPEWACDAVIYEINVRQYTPEGTFAALEPHLPRLKDLGVEILWLMPVQPIGRENRKGGLGSYYSIADYTAINPEHGDETDFRRFVDAAHAHGFKVILDWVANHTAFDHHWTREHPDFYTRRPDGSISVARDLDGKETDWTDVADLNYDNAALRRAMIDEMRWWVEGMGIDGFRADIAGFVPYDFWAEATRELRALKPDLFLLAESEDPRLHAWFDMTYAWELHHLLNSIARGEKPTSELDAYVARQAAEYPADAYRMTFTSNHDENSWQGSEFERMGVNHLPAFVLAATLEGSMPLLYTGQEASLSKRLRFFDKDTVDWTGPSLAAFYRTLFELKRTQPALANGAAGGEQHELRTDGGDGVYAFTRTRGGNTVLVAVNFGGDVARIRYEGLAAPGEYADAFGGTTVELAAAGRLEIPPNGYRVLVR